jgi:mannitol-1-phosphate 5-dehydrogenase
VETSIGKMVPLMTEKDLAADPLVLHAEAYNTLILDRNGFKGTIPNLPQIKAVKNIAAWVDRKLFIHNLGHAATAYLGHMIFPEKKYIADIIADKTIKEQVKNTMLESAKGLAREYPQDFTMRQLEEHIDDLLSRFGNLALGDTVYRVGRDLPRKLNPSDRILGAISLCQKHNLPTSNLLKVFEAGLAFKAVDSEGQMFEADRQFHHCLQEHGLIKTLEEQLKMSPHSELVKILKKREEVKNSPNEPNEQPA